MAQDSSLAIVAAVIAILTFTTSVVVLLHQQLDRAIRLDNEIAEMAEIVLCACLQTLELVPVSLDKISEDMLFRMLWLDNDNMEKLREIMKASTARRILQWEKKRDLMIKNLRIEEGIRAVFQLMLSVTIEAGIRDVSFEVANVQMKVKSQCTTPETKKSEPSPPDRDKHESKDVISIKSSSSQEESREAPLDSHQGEDQSHKEGQRRTPTPPPNAGPSFSPQIRHVGVQPERDSSINFSTDKFPHNFTSNLLLQLGSELSTIHQKGSTASLKLKIEENQVLLREELLNFLKNRKIRSSQLSDLLMILAFYLLGQQGIAGRSAGYRQGVKNENVPNAGLSDEEIAKGFSKLGKVKVGGYEAYPSRMDEV